MDLIKFLTGLINIKSSCRHEKVSPDKEYAYCPDCGKLIKNEWYITRCSCCGVKMKAVLRSGEVVPQNHYCSNCGSSDFAVEKLDKISFINVNFAVPVKTIAECQQAAASTIRCWQEKTTEIPRLQVKYP